MCEGAPCVNYINRCAWFFSRPLLSPFCRNNVWMFFCLLIVWCMKETVKCQYDYIYDSVLIAEHERFITSKI